MDKREERIERLARGIQRCRRCGLYRGRTHAVPGEGDVDAAGMMIGEAPGEEEDKSGRPFVGRTGRFFNSVLADCGLPRQSLFITSAVKCRPPKNRDPNKAELFTCRKNWLEKQIETVDARAVLVLGRIAYIQNFEDTSPLKDVRGDFFERNGSKWLVTYHPTAAMRFPWIEETFRIDLERFAAVL